MLLVYFAEQYAVNNGFQLIELHARDTAMDFYLKQNYKIEGAVFLEVGIPHYKMKKVLV
jgi:predicted GNAT family N-acyltransferase